MVLFLAYQDILGLVVCDTEHAAQDILGIQALPGYPWLSSRKRRKPPQCWPVGPCTAPSPRQKSETGAKFGWTGKRCGLGV